MNNQQIIDTLKEPSNFSLMSAWETKFVSDVSERYAKSKRLSPAQRAILDKTLNRVLDVKNGNIVVDTTFIGEIDNLINTIGSSGEYYQIALPSFKQQLEAGKTLTENQMKIVEQAKRFAVDNKEIQENWNEEKKQKFDIACRYYSKTPYFTRVIKNWNAEDNYIPNCDDYEKMTNNKYFVKVFNNWNEKPKFNNGQLVRITSTRSFHACSLANVPYDRGNTKAIYCGFVVSSNSDIPIAKKGGKIYKVLMFGSTTPINIEEAELRFHKI